MHKILSGDADANIGFAELVALLKSLGFHQRQEGSHHVFSRPGLQERINLQRDGSKAKQYQVRQVRRMLREHASLLK